MMMKKPQTISILIPVYNEVSFLVALLDKVEAVNFCDLQKEIIMVDDGSTDGTRDILKRYEGKSPYQVIFHEKNKGKGAALRTALQYASGDIIVIQDADLEYDPKDYPELIQLILDGKADVVYGSRLTAGKPVRAFNVLHYFGNKFLTLVTNILYNTTLTDMETCYKAFKADYVKNVVIHANRFDFEPEITAKVLKQGARLYEAPISYCGRNFDEGKKITWKDGISALWTLLKYRFVD
ncbi:glycosyltransferase family 2 protein [Vampirovibrio sp.]|uniref:glycosyltransferase family 2 protein n=1 Tax=Vampirovibrio sp. TaxID=2717857 RepID=UPI0035934377